MILLEQRARQVASNGRMFRRLGWMAAAAGLVVGCGPHGYLDGHADDHYPDGPSEDSSMDGYADDGIGGGFSTGGGLPGAGGSAGCDFVQPQQTYICSGYAYESSLAGAAVLRLAPETCGEPPWGTGGAGTGGSWATGGGSAVGGGPMGGEAAGGGMPYPEYPIESAYPGESGGADSLEPYYPYAGGAWGYGGEPGGIGGAAVGGTSSGGASGGPSAGWCESEATGTVLAGFSFAVGACQDVDVALPLVFEEPYYGEYELVVFGSDSSCERGAQISKVAGIGAGQILEVPVNTSGFSFITVEYRGPSYYDFGIRLRDRPHVVPTPSE